MTGAWEEYLDFYRDLDWLWEAFFTVNLLGDKLPALLAYAKLQKIPKDEWPELLWGVKVIAREVRKTTEQAEQKETKA